MFLEQGKLHVFCYAVKVKYCELWHCETRQFGIVKRCGLHIQNSVWFQKVELHVCQKLTGFCQRLVSYVFLRIYNDGHLKPC